MTKPPPFTWGTWFLWLLVFAGAGGARAWYLVTYLEKGETRECWHVQDPSPTAKAGGESELDLLTANLQADGLLKGFRTVAPLGSGEPEATAHLAPGYPIFRAVIEKYLPGILSPIAKVRWAQTLLGSLTAAFYFCVA